MQYVANFNVLVINAPEAFAHRKRLLNFMTVNYKPRSRQLTQHTILTTLETTSFTFTSLGFPRMEMFCLK